MFDHMLSNDPYLIKMLNTATNLCDIPQIQFVNGIIKNFTDFFEHDLNCKKENCKVLYLNLHKLFIYAIKIHKDCHKHRFCFWSILFEIIKLKHETKCNNVICNWKSCKNKSTYKSTQKAIYISNKNEKLNILIHRLERIINYHKENRFSCLRNPPPEYHHTNPPPGYYNDQSTEKHAQQEYYQNVPPMEHQHHHHHHHHHSNAGVNESSAASLLLSLKNSKKNSRSKNGKGKGKIMKNVK